MAGKLNLAKLDKKREEISETEMTEVKAGNFRLQGEPVSQTKAEDCKCEHWIEYADNEVLLEPPIADCHCSIWMAFGMLWG